MVSFKHIIETIDDYYKSYSHKPHLARLPYDLNTNDPKKLKERLKANNKALREAQSELKDMKENLEMNEGFIQEAEDDIKALEDENKELLEKNAQIDETIHKVYDHFEDVTLMTENDGWEIKKSFDSLMNEALLGYTDFDTDPLKDKMKYFVDEISLKGYIGPEEIDNYINPIIEDLEVLTSYYEGDNLSERFFNNEVESMILDMETYRDKYDISKDTPLTQQLNKIESEGNLSDKWDRIQQANEKKIKKNEDYIEGNKRNLERLAPRHAEIKREISKLETEVKDHEEHKQKINDKLEKLGEA